MAARMFCLALCLASARAAFVRSGAFLATDGGERMRPEVVASTLAYVEDEWKAQATEFSECNATVANARCQESPASFAKSCATVVSAVVQGSGGDREVAKEYMDNVCGQKSLAGWHKLRCNDLASAIVNHAMSADNYANRQNLNPSKLCTAFWSKFVEAEQKREAEEAKERAEREKKEAAERAEREKKEAEEAAAAKKKAEEEAKAKAKKEAEEAAKNAEEKAKREAAEAKARAAEAAKRLAEKKAEAEAVQKAAQQKLEEAKKAEEEQQARQAEHKKAEELLKNVTKAVNSTSDGKTEKPVVLPAASKQQANSTASAEAPKAVEAPVAKKVESVAKSNTTNATAK